MIPNDFIQTLLSRVDVVEVVSRYVPLKKAGANFAACCPFHAEHTPSFTVSPAKQFYHCFGCGAHGTAIGFLMEHTGCGFVEAVHDLARQAGLPVPHGVRPAEAPPGSVAVSDLHAVLLAAAKYYRQQLKATPRAVDYLKQRGLTGEIAAKFGIGYAPMSWQALAEAFADYADSDLERAGLVAAAEGGRRHDRLRDRIVFPIHDLQGRVIGFGGRVIGGGEPKYLNSPETSTFSKGRELYGLYQARQAIKDSGRALVVEGYLDVIALAQHGIDYAVATLGTATTSAHLQKLFRHTDRIVFCFDGDAAGRRAAWRALENALPVLTDGKRLDFLFLPAAHDPDSFIRAEGRGAFEQLLADAVPLSDYLVRELAARHDPASTEGRAGLLAAAGELIAQLPAPMLAALLRKRLATAVELGESDLDRLLPGPSKSRSLPPVSASRASSRLSATRKAICILLWNPCLGRGYADLEPVASDPEAAAFRALLAAINADPHTPELNTASLLELFRDSPHLHTLEAANASNLDLDESFEPGDWHAHVERLRSHTLETEAKLLYAKACLSDLQKDPSALVRHAGRVPVAVQEGSRRAQSGRAADLTK